MARTGRLMVALAVAGTVVVVVTRQVTARTTSRARAGREEPVALRALRPQVEGADRDAQVARGVVTVAAGQAETYATWRDFARLPEFMAHLESVRVVDEQHSHWVARSPFPGSPQQEWDAEVLEEDPPHRIAWTATSETHGSHQGVVTFTPAPGDRGCEVRVEIRYEPPPGVVGRTLGEAAARVAGRAPQQQVREGLRRFKSLIECGEAVEVSGQPSGRGGIRRAVGGHVAARMRRGGRS